MLEHLTTDTTREIMLKPQNMMLLTLNLREVSLGYSFPQKMINQLPITNARISVTGRNLILWTDNPHFDPETVGVSGWYATTGYREYVLPKFTFVYLQFTG